MRFDPATHTVHAAGRRWPADPSRTEIHNLDAGRFTHHTRRCLVRFESGWSASIVWGSCTYSSNHDSDLPGVLGGAPFTEEPTTVEVGVLDHTGELRMRNGDGPEAYLDDTQLAALLDQLATMPTDHDYGKRSPTMADMADAYEQVRQAMAETGRDLPRLPEPPT